MDHGHQGKFSPLALWQYIQVWRMVSRVQLSTSPDVLQWRWTQDSQYTSKSCYDDMFQGVVGSSSWKLLKVLSSPEGQVFHLACLSGSLLDY